MSSELLLIHTPVKHRLLREDFPDGLLVQPSLARALSVLVPCAGMTATRLGSPLLTGLCNGESTGPSLPLGFEPLGVVRKVVSTPLSEPVHRCRPYSACSVRGQGTSSCPHHKSRGGNQGPGQRLLVASQHGHSHSSLAAKLCLGQPCARPAQRHFPDSLAARQGPVIK